MERFADIGAVHGVRYVLNSRYGNLTRFFWCLMIILSICGFFYYLYFNWQKLMFKPEILVKNNERKIEEFVWPAITLCPYVFANDSFARLRDVNNSYIKHTPESCQYKYANLHWCAPSQIKDLFQFCDKEVLYNTNVVDKILESSLDYKNLIIVPSRTARLRLEPQTTVLSNVGPCYSYNLLSYSSLFKTENIHDDFKQFQKFIDDNKQIEDNSTWTVEKGLKRAKNSTIKDIKNKYKNFHLAFRLSPNDSENACFEKTARVYIHKPNEIVTTMHEHFELNFNEVMLIKTIKFDFFGFF